MLVSLSIIPAPAVLFDLVILYVGLSQHALHDLFREKVIEASRLKALPPFALTNHVNEATVFYPKLDEVSVKKDLFVGALKDGWILIYDAVTHRFMKICCCIQLNKTKFY